MQEQRKVIECYNSTAESYAEKFTDELEKKHLDRLLLKAFATENSGKGKLIDLGCGPGQTTRFLADCGITNITGTDISPAMIRLAQEMHPTLQFETADMLTLPYADGSVGAAIAFYSIVHFDYEQLRTAFNEVRRALSGNGQFLFSFHIGDHILHLDNFLDKPVDIDFYFFNVNKIIGVLTESGFEMIDVIERQPYPEVEYQSKRAYIWAHAV